MLPWACIDGSAILHSSLQNVPILYNGPPLPLSKLPLPWGIWTPIRYMVPSAHPSSQPVSLSYELEDSVAAKIYCLHALADSS